MSHLILFVWCLFRHARKHLPVPLYTVPLIEFLKWFHGSVFTLGVSPRWKLS